MRRFAWIFAACLLAPGLLALPGSAAAMMEEAELQSAYVRVTLTHDGQRFAHPGFRIARDEQGLFVIDCEGTAHEIAVSIAKAEGNRVTLLVAYDIEGREQLREQLEVEIGTPGELRKGETTLAIDVDPQGSKDTSRDDEDKIEGPGGDDPLG